MGQNELITGWVYKKGELLRKRLSEWNMAISVIAAMALTLLSAWPILNWNMPLKGKSGGWIFVISFFLLAIIINFILKFFSGFVFSIYKKLYRIKEEEIIFTNYKITSTNKTWILNDENNKLTSVNLSQDPQSNNLVFKVTSNKHGKAASTHSIDIPVPPDEMINAEKVYTYFNSRYP